MPGISSTSINENERAINSKRMVIIVSTTDSNQCDNGAPVARAAISHSAMNSMQEHDNELINPIHP